MLNQGSAKFSGFGGGISSTDLYDLKSNVKTSAIK